VLLHEHLIRPIRADIIKAELDKETYELGMLFYVGVYEYVFAGVLGPVTECGLQEELANLAPTDVMANLECAELQSLAIKALSLVGNDLVDLNIVYTDRAKYAILIPISPRLSVLSCLSAEPVIETGITCAQAVEEGVRKLWRQAVQWYIVDVGQRDIERLM